MLRRPPAALMLAVALAAPAGSATPAVATPTAATPPEETADGDKRFSEAVEVRYVLVPVTARDRRGLVTDLEMDDFRLTVDGRPVPIESFDRGSELPASLVVLQDLSGSMAVGGKLAAARAAVSCLLDRRQEGDRIALASFADRRTVVDVPFTADEAPVREAMAAWRAYGVTALYDAVAQLASIDARDELPGKAAVLLTDGVENASRLAPERARELVRRARLPVYVIDLGAPGAAPAGSRRAILRQLAYATGGRYLPAGNGAAAIDACVQVVTELRGRYVVGFSSGRGERRWRRVRVEIGRRGLTSTARSGYLGGPAAAADMR